MLRIALAECRRLILVFPFGAAVWLLVAFAIYRQLTARLDEFLCDPSCQLLLTKLLFVCLVYGLGPSVGWTQGGPFGPYAGTTGTYKLIETLPYSLFRLNLLRILTGVVFMVPALATWAVTLVVWRQLGLTIPWWVPVFALLVMIAFQLISLTSKVLRYVLPGAFALLFIPGSERLLRFAFEGMTEAWASVTLAVLMLAYGAWALRKRPPHGAH